MNGFELFTERDNLSRELSASIDVMANAGCKYAKAEAEYKIELAKTALELKDKGMAVTMISMVINGTGNVPKLRMERDIAEVMYRTSQEKIQSLKLQLRIVEAQIEREWSQANRNA